MTRVMVISATSMQYGTMYSTKRNITPCVYIVQFVSMFSALIQQKYCEGPKDDPMNGIQPMMIEGMNIAIR